MEDPFVIRCGYPAPTSAQGTESPAGEVHDVHCAVHESKHVVRLPCLLSLSLTSCLRSWLASTLARSLASCLRRPHPAHMVVGPRRAFVRHEGLRSPQHFEPTCLPQLTETRQSHACANCGCLDIMCTPTHPQRQASMWMTAFVLRAGQSHCTLDYTSLHDVTMSR